MLLFLMALQEEVQGIPVVPVEEPSISFISIVIKGGWVMIPIILCSLIAIWITLEKIFYLRRIQINTNHFMLRLRSLILKDNIDEAISLCSNTPGPIAKVLMKGMSKGRRTKKDMQEIIETAGREEIHTMESLLGVLASIAAVSPMIGFFGTVTGMIRAFMAVQQLGGNVNASVLAGGIWEALLTTAAGLAVGIPTYLAYNYFVTKVERFVLDMEVSSSEIIDLIYAEEANEATDRKEVTEGI